MPLDKRFLALIASVLLAYPALAEEAAKPDDGLQLVGITQTEPDGVPDLQWLDSGGNRQTLDASHAKLTVVHLWATWCLPCLKELPKIDKIAASYYDHGLRVVALALDGADTQRLRDYFSDHGIDHLLPNYDKNNLSLRALHGNVLPMSVFINARGQIIARADGPVDWEAKETRKFLEAGLK